MVRLTKINLERSHETDFGCFFAYACGVHVTLQDYWIFRSTSRVYNHCTFSSRCSRNLRIHRFSIGIICLLLLLFICFCLSVCLLLVVGFLSDQVGLGDRKDIRPLSRRVICGGEGGNCLPQRIRVTATYNTTLSIRTPEQISNDIDRMNTCTALLLSPQTSFSPVNLSNCLATHLSASDSFTTMALYKSIYLLESAPKCIISIQKPQTIFWGRAQPPPQPHPHWGEGHPLPRPHPTRR